MGEGPKIGLELGDHAAAELLFRRLTTVMEELGPEHFDTLLTCNEFATELRKSGQVEWAELLQRHAATASAKARSESQPLSEHYRINLVLCLVMQGKLPGARQQLVTIWKVNAPAHQKTTPRIVFLRANIALLEAQSGEVFVGQLKSCFLVSRCRRRRTWQPPWTSVTLSIFYARSCQTVQSRFSQTWSQRSTTVFKPRSSTGSNCGASRRPSRSICRGPQNLTTRSSASRRL